MSDSIPASLRGNPNSYMPILARKGIPLTSRNKTEVHKVLDWLHAKRQAGHFADVPFDSEAKARFIESVKRQYKQETYGSVMIFVVGVVIKIIISLIIEYYFS